MAPFFFGAMNEVSMELALLVVSSARLALATASKFGLFASDWCSCAGTDNAFSLTPNRDGVCDRDVARDEQRDDGLELRDWRKSSIGISSDLICTKKNIWIWDWSSEVDRNWVATYLGLGVLGLDSRDLILPLLPFTRFRDASLDLAPPTALFGERSLQIDIKSCQNEFWLKMCSDKGRVQFELQIENKKLPIDLSIVCDLNATHTTRRCTLPS